MNHLSDELAELALGTLDPSARAEAHRHLAACPHCRAELAHHREALAAASLAIPPEPPAVSTRDRLLRDAATPGPGAFADLVARLFDLEADRARGLLVATLGGGSWTRGPVPGMEIVPFRPGPRLAGALCCLARFLPNVRFPNHRHLGVELTAVLDGGFDEDGGDEYAAGATMVKLPGSSHGFTCHRSGCLAVVGLFDGIEVDEGSTTPVAPNPRDG